MTDQNKTTSAAAKARWDADRKSLAPDWPMPAWSRAPAWRRRPYLMGWDQDALPEAETDV